MGERQHADPLAAGREGGPVAPQGPRRRWLGLQGAQGWATAGVAQVVPGVLLEANLPGDGEWEDDEDTESREGEALVCIPGRWGGALTQRPVGVQGVAHCGGAAGGQLHPEGWPKGTGSITPRQGQGAPRPWGSQENPGAAPSPHGTTFPSFPGATSPEQAPNAVG